MTTDVNVRIETHSATTGALVDQRFGPLADVIGADDPLAPHLPAIRAAVAAGRPCLFTGSRTESVIAPEARPLADWTVRLAWHVTEYLDVDVAAPDGTSAGDLFAMACARADESGAWSESSTYDDSGDTFVEAIAPGRADHAREPGMRAGALAIPHGIGEAGLYLSGAQDAACRKLADLRAILADVVAAGGALAERAAPILAEIAAPAETGPASDAIGPASPAFGPGAASLAFGPGPASSAFGPRQWSAAEQSEALAEGWILSDVGGVYIIERDDDAARFDSDSAAVAHVRERAEAGSATHRRALDLLGRVVDQLPAAEG